MGQTQRHSKFIGKERFQATTEELEAARLSLAGQVAKAWFDMIENEGQVRLAQETANTYSQTQSLIESRFEKGLGLGLGGQASALDNHLANSSLYFANANLSLRKRIFAITLKRGWMSCRARTPETLPQTKTAHAFFPLLI